MRRTSIWKRLACMTMTAVVAGTLLAGCGSSNETASAEATTAEAASTEATEAAAEAATEEAATTEAATDKAESNPALATESGPVVDGEASDDGTLAPFVYVGNSEEGRICTAQAQAIADEDEELAARDDVVTIPGFVVADETADGDTLELLVNINVYTFELDGTTLRFVAGGSYPCRIQAKGGEITSAEIAYTDQDTIDLCDGDESLEIALHDNDALDTSLQNNIGMYVNNYGYDIDAYEITGTTYSIDHQ